MPPSHRKRLCVTPQGVEQDFTNNTRNNIVIALLHNYILCTINLYLLTKIGRLVGKLEIQFFMMAEEDSPTVS